MKQHLSGLRVRLLGLVLMAYIPVVVLFIWSARRERAESLAALQGRLLGLADAASDENDAVIESGRRIIGTWAQVPEIQSGAREACEAAFSRLSRFAPSLASPTRIDSTGIVSCGGVNVAAIGSDLSAVPLFQLLMASDSIVMGPYLPSAGDREPLAPLNVVLRDEAGRRRGILSVGVRMRWLKRLSQQLASRPGSVVTLADSTGLVLARYPEIGIVGTRIPDLAQRLRTYTQRGTDLRGFDDDVQMADGETRFLAHRRLTSTATRPTYLAIGIPRASIYGESDARLRQTLLWLSVAAALALAIAWWAADVFVLRDVERVLNATKRLGAGELTARTGVTSEYGELAELARGFDAMANELQVRQDRMLQAQKLESLGRLAGGVAHDFNNLLTAIVGSADVALDELPEGHPAREDLDRIKAAAGRSSSLTRQLLTFAQHRAPEGPPFRLNGLLRETSGLLTRLLPASVSLTVRGESQLAVRADAGRLEQVLVNLAVNARDAMPNGGVLTLAIDDVSLTEDAVQGTPLAAGAYVRLQVADTGTGMSPAVLHRVFEPFFTTKPPGQGTGLGLAMVYGTIQQHGGHVTVESALGEGTTVSVFLPGVPDLGLSSSPVTPSPSPVGRHGRILLAEDEPGVRAVMARVLTRAGYDVVIASNGREAIDLATSLRGTIDLLVTDYEMPMASGEMVAMAARTMMPDLPVLVVSGYTRDGRPETLLSSPNTRFLAKPFAPSALLDAVREMYR